MSTVCKAPPRSQFLLQIRGFGPAIPDEDEWQRSETRQRRRNVFVSMKRSKGPIRCVRVYDVTKTGISVLSRDPCYVGEVVSLGPNAPIGPFQRFRVVHVTHEGRAFRIGMQLDY